MVSHVRAPRAGEARRLAEIHVASWRAAYRGLLPDDYLEALDADDRLPWWSTRLASGGGAGTLLLGVTGEDDRLQGFSAGTPDPGVEGRAEVRMFYLEPAAWGRGLGRLLMGAVLDALVGLGHREASLWVHPANVRARHFYEAAGWSPTGETRREDVWGADLPETGYRLRLDRSRPGAPGRSGRR